MKHLLPPLRYAYSALEPHLDARTMELHHGQHHAGYVKALNDALEPFPLLQDRPASWLLLHLGEVPHAARAAIGNNAGGHLNHSLYWRNLAPEGGGAPTGPLADAIERDFGSQVELQAQFDLAGSKLFGSGWVWLVRARGPEGKLSVVTTAGHENPISLGLIPILVNDVWEHAYYLRHQNRRLEFLQAFWSVADWHEAARRFERQDHVEAEHEWENEGGKLLPSAA